MAQPVWVLSVDLQTKTATFNSGMADAARNCRNAFTDIKEGSRAMGGEVNYNMTEARHGVHLLAEEFGIHMPRALVSFIAELGPVSAAMEAAFPFLAIIVGATLLIEHLHSLKEAGEKLTESQIKFGTAAENALGALDTKLLEAGIKADDLNMNHLAALHKQLELIDRQSMAELVQTFGVLAKAADEVFKNLDKHWYQFGSGSAGAKASLEQFKTEYDALLAKKDDKGAAALLGEKLSREQQILDLQKEAATYRTYLDPNYKTNLEARTNIQKMGAAYDKDAIAAQEILVRALHDQAEAQKTVQDLKGMAKTNATKVTDNKIGADQDKAFKIQAEAEKQALENQQKAWDENYKRAVSDLQENERLKIDATSAGSAERLAAIDAAIKEEQSKGLQETGFYKSMLHERADLSKAIQAEEEKLKAEAGKEDAEHNAKMGELILAADREQAQLRLSAMRNSEQARRAEEIRAANADYVIKSTSIAKQIEALSKGDKEYENKLKALNDRKLELDRAHENQVTQIKIRAEEERNARILSASRHRDDAIAGGMTSVLMRHESFSKMMIGLGDQVAAGMIQNAIKSILADDMTKPHDAAKAARKAFNAGMEFPFPVNLVMAPALGAMAFASVMAFEKGGIVGGTGTGDTVHAMLTPGETVLPKKMTENLSKASGSDGKGGDVHVHHHATYNVQSFDSRGVDAVLQQHGEKFTQHATRELRKMNR